MLRNRDSDLIRHHFPAGGLLCCEVNMSFVATIIVAVAALTLALLFAYVPMRLLVGQMAKAVAAPIRELIQRQRDRRAMARRTPDRRR